jgi:hypothetical protein
MPVWEPVVLTQVIGFGVCLWLGLYLLVRAERRTPLIIVALTALFGQAIFFGSSVLTFSARDLPTLVALERTFWWSAVLPVLAWLHFSDLIARQSLAAQQQREAPVWTPLMLLAYAVAATIVILGTLTDLFLNYSQPIVVATERYAYLDRGPLYPAQIAFLGLCAVGALFNLARSLGRFRRGSEPSDQALARQLRLLAGGALLFLIGGLYIASRYSWNPDATVLPGYLALFFGLAGVSYGIANFGLLLEGKSIRRDFFYNLTGIVLMNLLYITLLSLSDLLSIRTVLVLVGLVVLTHTTVDSGRRALDRLFFSQAEQAARAEARDYATDLGTTPVTPPTLLQADEPQVQEAPAAEAADAEPPGELANEKMFRSVVRKALTGLKSPPQLAKSPLLTLKLVERRVAQAGLADNRLNRVAALRELLIEQIEGLRPKDDSTTHVGEAWRFYNVLYYPYVRELSRKAALAEARRLEKERRRNGRHEPDELEQVLAWLADVDEDTFYKWQRRASDTIASILWEEDQKALT